MFKSFKSFRGKIGRSINPIVYAPASGIVQQLVTNSSFNNGTTGWTATGGFQTYNYSNGSQAAVDSGILYFSYVNRTVSQSVSVSSIISQVNSFTGICNIKHREKSDAATYSLIDTYNFTLNFKNSGGTSIITKTTGTVNAPQNYTDISLVLNRSEIPSTFNTIATVDISISGIDNGFWAGNHGPMVDYITLTTT